MVDTVAVPIENQINGVENMLYMSSSSDDNGSYSLTITFDVGTDPDIAQVKVQNRLSQVMSQLPALGLSSTDIVNAISSQNIQASVGQIGAAPSDRDTALVLSLTAKGLLNDVRDFENIVVTTDRDGGIVRLSDVARIELGADNYNMNAHFDNAPAVIIGLSQTPNSNSLDIMKRVRANIQ